MNVEAKLRTALRMCAIASVVGCLSAPAAAYTWFTEDALFTSFFPGESTSPTTWTPTPTELAALRTTLGYPVPRASFGWTIAGSAQAPTGFAIIDEQLGQHEPITFGVKLGADCVIDRIEVMVYREAYGDGVRAEPFRRQFAGKTARDPLRVGKDIQLVSGATVSSRSLATGARRAAVLCEVWRAGLGRV